MNGSMKEKNIDIGKKYPGMHDKADKDHNNMKMWKKSMESDAEMPLSLNFYSGRKVICLV